MKRSFKHWTPAYLANRLRERFYRRMHPDLPWLSPQAIQVLSESLTRTDVGLEFGSGRSTLWLAQRVGFLTSIEHNPEWHRRISNRARQAGFTNLTCLLAAKEGEDSPKNGVRNATPNPAYARTAERFADGSLDFILVDGIYRDACANASLSKLRDGGLLILDDAHRYLPSESTSPYARTAEQGPASPGWTRFLEAVRDWRFLWTSNGVSDTVIFYKP
jgi:predicted O-methyltransferase YrrM